MKPRPYKCRKNIFCKINKQNTKKQPTIPTQLQIQKRTTSINNNTKQKRTTPPQKTIHKIQRKHQL